MTAYPRRYHTRRLLQASFVVAAVVALLFPWFAVSSSYAQDQPGEGQQVVIQNVDRVEQRIEDGERVRYLFGNVRLLQDSTYLQSDRAVQFLERDEIFFFDNVLLADRGDSLRADTVFYNRRSKIGEALGRVEISDGEVRVFAPSALHFTDERRSDFREGVTLIDSLSTLSSITGVYLAEENRADFAGMVQLVSEDTFLEADSVRYYRDEERSIARGSVLIERFERDEGQEDVPADSLTRTYLLGDYAYNDEQEAVSLVEGRALVYQLRYEDESLDTLLLRADWLHTANRNGHRRITAVGDVKSWQTDFSAVADSAVYDRYEPGSFPRPGEPPREMPDMPPHLLAMMNGAAGEEAASPGQLVPRDSLRLEPVGDVQELHADAEDEPAPAPSDSAALLEEEAVAESGADVPEDEYGGEADEPLEEVRLYQDPIGWFEESQMSADTIRVRSGGGAPVDSIFGHGHVFLAQLDSVTQRIHQLRGQRLVGISKPDSIREFDVWPNTEAVYHRTNDADEPDGSLRVSADEGFFRFKGEDLEYIHFAGNPEGRYWEEDLVPDPLQLDGFIWLPNLRPSKATLLNDVPDQRVQLFSYLTGKLLPGRPPPPHHWLQRGLFEDPEIPLPPPELPELDPLPTEVPLPEPTIPPDDDPPPDDL